MGSIIVEETHTKCEERKNCHGNECCDTSETTMPLTSRFSRPALLHLAFLISFLTVLHNVVEGVLSLFFGTETASVSLSVFGVGSFVEVLSALLVAWRFWAEYTGYANLALERERKATLGVGVLMCLLSLGTLAASIIALARHESPENTLPGLIISAAVIFIMVALYLIKRYLARALDSSIIRSDAKCTLSCVQLSTVLLIGSLVYKVAPGVWWIDAAAALVLAGLFGKEGLEMAFYARSEGFNGGCGCAE